MRHTTTASEVLDREFLSIRSRLLDLAAALDRIDRAQGPLPADPRLDKIRQGFGILSADAPDRAEAIQMIFSLPYTKEWSVNSEQ